MSMETNRLFIIPFTRLYVDALLEDKAYFKVMFPFDVSEEWPNPDYEAILPFIQKAYEENPEREKWSFLIIHKQDQKLIGEIGCKDSPNEDGEIEIGYGVVPSYRGNGYASEAAKELVRWLIAEIGVDVIKADCLHHNIGSIRVLEHAGFKKIAEDKELIYWEVRNK